MVKHLRVGSAAVALMATFAAAPFLAAPLGAQETSISGLFFGDYYAVPGHHDDVEDANGFWIRRLYLTFNTNFSEAWDSRVRFEASSPGDFESAGKMEPFVKDLWLRWKAGRHAVIIGLSPSPTWDAPEGAWGYRDLEKTPMDLFKLGSSRDFGVALKGAFDEAKRVEYHVMVGNGSAAKGEINQGKKYAGALILHPTSNVTLHAYADHEDLPGQADRNTFEVFGSVAAEPARVGVMWARQNRQRADAEDLHIDVISGYAVLDATDQINLVARVDRLLDPNPDGAKISYFKMDPTAKATFFLLALDVKVADRAHLMPNIEFVRYDDMGGVTRDSDVFLKTTFSIKF